jgi:hypothetical protein
MIKFFRKIRQNLLSEGKTGKYLKYAIGEIVLVVIGILIALSINNWNENRKSKRVVKEIYRNLEASLVQDSTQVQRILKFNTKSLEVQKELILNEKHKKSIEIYENNLVELFENIYLGIYSFFPKKGIYNSIVSKNGMNLINSKQIKTSLINLYDHQYERYDYMDATVESKYNYQLLPVIYKKMEYMHSASSSPNPTLFKENFKELVSECRNVYDVLDSNKKLLTQISKEINELLKLIRIELEK